MQQTLFPEQSQKYAKNGLINSLIYLCLMSTFIRVIGVTTWVKTYSKEPPKVNGHYLKLHFCMFEKSQMKHNSLDCHNIF